jgi:hypothetical protein
MKLFGQRAFTAVEQAQAALEQCVTKRERIAAQFAQSQAELASVKGAAADAALRESALEVSEIAGDVAQCAAAVEALEHALGTADAEVVKAEQALAVERDREQRAASVAELTALIDQIEASSLPFGDALADLLAPLRKAAEISHDVKASCGFVELLQSDMPQMLENATSALGLYARNIELGSAPARLPRPAPTPVAISASPPPTTSVFPLFDIRWTDHAGAIRYAARGWDAPLPIATAQRALVAGIVVAGDSPQAVQGRKERGSVHADLDRAVDLDQANPTPPPPPPERWINPSRAVWQLPGDTPPSWFGKAPT